MKPPSSDDISTWLRWRVIARRKPSAPLGVMPPTVIAISMICSW